MSIEFQSLSTVCTRLFVYLSLPQRSFDSSVSSYAGMNPFPSAVLSDGFGCVSSVPPNEVNLHQSKLAKAHDTLDHIRHNTGLPMLAETINQHS